MAKFARAWESADLGALVALLTDDVFMSMPPMPFEYQGRDVVARFCASLFGAGRRFDLVPDASQRPARVRGLPARPHRHPPRRPASTSLTLSRRPDLRHDPLRQQRAAVVRAAARSLPRPVASPQRLIGSRPRRVTPDRQARVTPVRPAVSLEAYRKSTARERSPWTHVSTTTAPRSCRSSRSTSTRRRRPCRRGPCRSQP